VTGADVPMPYNKLLEKARRSIRAKVVAGSGNECFTESYQRTTQWHWS
jgi:protein involved in ribonucleotide reduction